MTTKFIAETEIADISSGIVVDMQSVMPDWEADESDPGVYWADIVAERLNTQIREFNSTLQEVYTERLVALSRQIKDTPEYVLSLINEILPNVTSVGLENKPANSQMLVYLLDSEGANPDFAIQQQVENYLSADSRHPFWIDYVVADTTITTFTVDATITYRYDRQSPEDEIVESLTAALTNLRALGSVVTPTILSGHMTIDDSIVKVEITSPSADLPRDYGVSYQGEIGTLKFVEEVV